MFKPISARIGYPVTIIGVVPIEPVPPVAATLMARGPAPGKRIVGTRK